MKIDFEELNIISAGAGSGKTYTVQETLSTWLKEHQEKVRADKILAVTFTNMAASEMQTRIRAALLSCGNMDAAMKVTSSQISTIHSFGQSIIQSFAYESGMSPRVRQLSEAEEKILLQLSLSSHTQINKILQKLEALGYKGKYNGSEFSTALDQLQSRVLQIINSLRTIGATKSKAEQYISLLSAETTALYGDVEDAPTLNKALHDAVKALLGSFQENMKEKYGGNATADNTFTADYKALKKALDMEAIKKDWGLWQSLKSLRTTKVDDQDYVRLATNVIDAANKLPLHPGPLEEAIAHIQTLLQISIDTLQNYNEAKRKNALMDFSDMVHLANSVMNEDEWIEEMASTYDCLVIDEFQDTNPIQFALLWKFRQKGLPTLIVGDLKQSIMGFQGADSSLFESLIGEAGATKHELENNWRSTPALMAWINAMGKGLYKERYTHLTPMAKYESSLTPLKIISFNDDSWSANGSKDGSKKSYTQEQYSVISQQIKEMIAAKTVIFDRHTKKPRAIEPSDIAILAPSHTMLGRAASSLRKNGIEAQIKQDGWFSSRIVQIAFYALSYLANPLDKHAALYLLVTELGDMSLQHALDMYLKDKKFTHPLIVKLDVVCDETQTLTLSRQLITMIEVLELWDYILKHDNSTQQRANLLKLIDHCSEFESLQFESLNALGIYGRNVNSFLSWLSMNENDAQPAPKSINTEAVQLLTWHASKGLEWPVVIVMGLERDKSPSLPDISLGYSDETRNDPLKNTYIRFFTKFHDDKSNEAYINVLEQDAHKTTENLLYVAMTRAREQLILSWPSYAQEKVGEFSFMHKLINKCNMKVNSDGIEMNDLQRETGFAESVIAATLPEESDESKMTSSIKYGRIAIEMMDEIEKIPSQTSPSSTKQTDLGLNMEKLTTKAYGVQVDLSGIKMSATNLGTVIHHCYHALLKDLSFSDRLFASFDKKLSYSVLYQLKEQVVAFQCYSKDELEGLAVQCEVPILSKTEQGSTVSGSIDLLLETKEGYWIIDHKSDRVNNFEEQFAYHYPQLEAYARFTKLDKPLLGLGINWVRSGMISLIKV